MAQGTARIGRDHYRTQVDLASGYTLFSDEPSVLGGEGAGATPDELLIAGLGACTAITLRMYADLKSWPLESVQVDLHLSREDNAMVIERSLRIVGLDNAQRTRLADIAEPTPVTLTLKAGIPIRTQLL
ncbi:putative redox protein [Variovorax boronicumulans]|uniref:OsmC family protein n=1 Tax=Variovorax boronicumulans TaxID=436515 RepID=UPI00277D4426|nr:OsmC family protein [Variovorax boronicumulans]MDP9920719.1 putative redox protein [Variovorax boronicumulans]